MTRRLLLGAAGGGGAFTVTLDPVEVIRAIVEGGPPAADEYGYTFSDDQGDHMDTLKVIDDGLGSYVGVYHGAATDPFDGHFQVFVATSPDLVNWQRENSLQTNANIPYIGRRADGSFVVAWSSELSPGRLEIRRYATRAELLDASHSDSVTLPRTLAAVGQEEGTPNFYDIEDPMSIGFHYNDGTRDHNGLGTLTGWTGTSYTSWNTATAAWDDDVLALDSFVTVASREQVIYLGEDVDFVGSQIASGAFFVNYWSGTAAEQQAVTTHGGSGDLDALRLSIVESPTTPGRQVLYCTMVIHNERGLEAPGEGPGPAYWWKMVP